MRTIFTNTFVEFFLIDRFYENHADELSTVCEEQIGFDCFRVSCFETV